MISPVNVVSTSLSRDELAQRKNLIVFWAMQGAMYQGLVQAIQAYLPDYDVLLVERLPDRETFSADVKLLLLDLNYNMQCADVVALCREQFPTVALGLVVHDADQDTGDCDPMFDRREIQGLLPLDLKLEVWLAALSLLVQGGEYYPPALSRRARAHEAAPGMLERNLAFQPMDSRSAAPARADPDGSIHLTRRERQVLELLSQGYQNKLIANRMELSEHTVKVHVHNLITKLGVTNRTQAAAVFRSGPLNSQAEPGYRPLAKISEFRSRY